MSYENSNPITDKFNFPDGSIRQLDGTIIHHPNSFNIKRYNQAEPIPNKFLHSDGSVRDREGNIIEEATEWRKKQYEQAVPIPAKFLKPDGSISESLDVDSSKLNYKLFAWKLGLDASTIGYTEIEDVQVGDVLLLPETMSSGEISDPSELKVLMEITQVNDDVIYAKKAEDEHSVYFTRDDSKDYEEEITHILGTSTFAQNGLAVAGIGTVYKSIETKVE